eukprot:TRINITY_DN2086_c0_g2_i1.p1 TRINITY_DN2086_c0_g2~~TRINITY_DN2086_c0_g2_i1.p1  ORF type:complete len:561 (+),score=153.24 TRINITY_DN2086_c0_g2_i1:1595-3277(+)
MRFQLALLAVLAVTIVSAYTPYREFVPYDGPFINNCPLPSSTPKWLSNLKDTLKDGGVSSRLVTDNSSLAFFAEDYGHWVHRAPLAVFAATSARDVSIFLKAAYDSRNKGSNWAFQVVNRGGSGNTNGNAQTACGAAQVVLDLTAINQISIQKGYFSLPSTAWVGAGANWESFVIATRDQGLRPTVVPDYLGITVGGIVSIGGLGADAVRLGPIVNQIIQAQIVQPCGDIDTVTFTSSQFAAMKGGLGQFGVFVSFQFLLVKNEPVTRVFHALVPSFQALSTASRHIINNGLGRIADGVQGFGVSNDRASYASFVAPESDLTNSNASLNAILNNGKTYVYYLEFLSRGTGDDLPTLAQVRLFFGSRVDPKLIFFTDYPTFDWDNRLELTVIPFLVAVGSWQAPHPWGAFHFDASTKTENYFDNYLQGQRNAEDLGFGLIALYPFPARNAFTLSASVGVTDLKGQDIFWHTTLGRTTNIPGAPANVIAGAYAAQAQQNRVLWDGFAAQGSSASFYPCGVLPNTTPEDWKRHFSPAGYKLFTEAKKEFDERNVFADTRNLYN